VWRKIIGVGIPKPIHEVIEDSDTGSITKIKATKDCIKGLILSCAAQSVREEALKSMDNR